MYETTFIPVRKSEFFLKDKYLPEIRASMKADLPRFIPQNVLSKYQENKFGDFIGALRRVISVLHDQGMKDYL